jgi:phosphate transport system protein
MYHYLEEGIDKLRSRLIKMGTIVEEQIASAFKALFDGDAGLAKIIIGRDEKIDKYELKIEKQCQRIIALTQPVALDLRLILSALSLNRDLERMGDCAVNIAKDIEYIKNHKIVLKEIELDKMTEQTALNVKNVLDAYINHDDALALQVIKSDAIVDRFDAIMTQRIIEKMMDDKELITAGSHTINVIKNIERLSDHATNIAEEVVFLIESKVIKHKKDINGTEENKTDNTEN